MRCVRAKGKEILDIAALLAFLETFGMGGVTVRKLLVRRPLCLCRFRFSLPRPSRLPPLSSVFSSAGTPDFHPESRESAERPAVFDTYVGNDRNFQPMKFERRGFAVRGWPGADRRLASITIRIRRPTRHLHNLPPVIARLLENIIISNR